MTEFKPGDRVEYVGSGSYLYASTSEIGNTGTVTRVKADQVYALWDRRGNERGVYPHNIKLIERPAETAKPDSDPVKHPNHYTWIPGIECMDVVKHFNFTRGAAIKYVWRAGRKGDKLKEIEDLRKAVENLNIEIKRLETTN